MERLREKAAAFGIKLSDHQLEQFETYYEMLVEKNKVMNLTAITEKNEVIDKHFADSLALIKSGVSLTGQKILDIGTGAGFPGIPLKIAFPELEIVLLDSLNKRIKFLNEVIEALGLEKITAIHGRAEDFAKQKESSHKPEIILLDLGLPDMEGVDVIKKVRTWSNVPIIVISARSEDVDKIEALDAGADDYITKPFSVDELLARIRVTQRRLALIQSGEEQEQAVFVNGELKIDYTAGSTYLKDKELHLTPIEYKLLCLLSHNVGKVLTHTYITQQIWGSSLENDVASLRVFMATLRKKLQPDKDGMQYIQTHIGIGYRMLKI